MALTHLDAGVIIGFLDADDAHHRSAAAALADVVHRGDRLGVSASVLAECLVGPSRKGAKAVVTVQQFVERLPIEVVALDAEIAERAAMLRARHSSLRLPDAFALAAAAVSGADMLITTDRRWPSAKKLGLSFQITVL